MGQYLYRFENYSTCLITTPICPGIYHSVFGSNKFQQYIKFITQIRQNVWGKWPMWKYPEDFGHFQGISRNQSPLNLRYIPEAIRRITGVQNNTLQTYVEPP